MRYYIEAFDKDDKPILGNLDGQTALGYPIKPWRTKAWKYLDSPSRPKWPRVKEWRLVDERGTVLRYRKNPHHLPA